ncbi:cytochrome c biogenesis protein CcdA [Cellulomonas sp. NTE-D12]|uniref:cytochrome c biogenesis CcdA family protein n=1 Tax=Cellulomonas sp. NTE-D12 TaxID=2962632 RepID=UPI00308178E0|nr:cytochrome c biogenesis protein [Cellulomonas sp. NTE-D12]
MSVAAGIGDAFGQAVASGSLLLAVPVALLAGVVSFASPCVLPLVPGYLGYLGSALGVTTRPTALLAGVPGAPGAGGAASASVDGQADERTAERAEARAGRRRLLAGVGLFVAGFTVVFVAFGALAGTVGAALLHWQGPISRALGVVVALLGLAFLGFVPFLQQERRMHLAPRAGIWAAPILGLTFGLGWTPCIGPTLAAILALSLGDGSAARGAVLAAVFCAGLGLPFLLVALGVERMSRAMALVRRHRVAVTRIGGGLLVVLGLAMVTGVWSTWAGWLQSLLTGTNGFVPVV